MTLINRELPESRSFSIAVVFRACPRCNYVVNPLELPNPQISCPKCNTQGETWCIFPNVSGIKLLKMVDYFYAGAYNRVKNLQDELVDDLRDKVGQTYTSQSAIDTAREIQNFYQKSGGGRAEYDRMLEIIQERLCLQSTEEAQRVFATLFGYSDTFEEHKAVVILTCTLLEKLFHDLLILIHVRNGTDWSKADKDVNKKQGFGELSKDFRRATSVSLENAIGECPISDFFSDWEKVRKARNSFVHESPYAIGVQITEKAFDLTKNAFSVFAYLQNRFCVRQIGTCGGV
jgi:hypothetical protein